MSGPERSKDRPAEDVLKNTTTRDLPPSQEIFATPVNEHFLKQYSYHDLNYHKHEIRLVHVFKKPGSDLIHGNLLPPQKLTDVSGKYHTISYCAGSAKGTRPIILQGTEFNVFANLDCALRETLAYWSTTKYSDDDCVLWIDQICINQHDDSERSHQTRLGQMPFLGFRSEMCSSILLDITMAEYIKGWNAFYDLLECPWWSRAWIRQEFACSRAAIFLYHNEAQDFSELSWLQAICHSDLVTNPHHPENHFSGPLLSRSEVKQEMKTLTNRRFLTIETCHVARFLLLQKTMLGDGPVECKMDFKKLALDARHSKATDPRDKVFSQLGLAHPGYNIMPNYSRSNDISRVLIDTAIKIILFEGDLNIFLYALQLAKAPSCQLPSWVPDWTSATASTISVFGQSENHQVASITAQIRHDAVGSIRFGASIDGSQMTVLFVKALRFGILERLCNDLPAYGCKRFTLSGGLTTQCRDEAELGDEIWLLMGTSCPYILRSTGKGYKLISEVVAIDNPSCKLLCERERDRMRTGLEVLEEISII
ncbi:heterokaryon incompatibility 6 OR allele [Fusarium subglutinans]|uniref:Heterokaryon incompatibility 6 OR allele n=1 Tax=Gibberella subglutinans TaxID=42677 RepID=A0A8H5V4D2_GIBSU|nr:heterokaryon incompatibility 6 OR allele [Fusarium subglutinans]KAF5608390.1 heterokaryon incompatibility 6 OR allele [Fusarium subglutinans]